MSNALNVIDLAIIILGLIFIIMAIFRGLTKEVFAFSNWIIAFSLSYFLAPYFAEFLKNYVESKIVVDLSARGIVFIIVFITIALSTSGLCKTLQEKVPQTLDRFLGVCFAIFKTLIIFGCLYSIYINVYGFILGNKLNDREKIQDPKFLIEAKSYGIIKAWGGFVDPVVKVFFNAISKNMEFSISKSLEFEDKINETVDDKSLDVDGSLKNLDKSSSQNEPEPGYNKKDIDKINNLIDKIEKK